MIASFWPCIPRIRISVAACLSLFIATIQCPAQEEHKPAHLSSLGIPFVSIAGTPVKFAQWETRVADFAVFVRESGYPWDRKPSFPQTGDHPVVNVDMADAQAFCEWLTQREQHSGVITPRQRYRLPTNAEWDKAVGWESKEGDAGSVKGIGKPSENIFPWGSQWPPPHDAGNFNAKQIDGSDDGYVFTAPVGSFRPSADGIYDLAGNVWEWTWDKAHAATSQDTATLRGGAWPYFSRECLLSSYHYTVPATLRKSSAGFRCVLEDGNSSEKYLAETQQQRQQERGGLALPAKVSDEEVEKFRQQIDHARELKQQMGQQPEKLAIVGSARTPSSASEPAPASADAPASPSVNLAMLRMGVSRAVFVNSLGMNFQPLKPYDLLIGENEVRVQDVAAWTASTGRTWEKKPDFPQTGEHPAVNVTWTEAREFCAWLTVKERAAHTIHAEASYRLPTDAEWSAAAGLPDEKGDTPLAKHLQEMTLHPWGTAWPPPPSAGNLDAAHLPGYADSFPFTAPVSSFRPNALHIYDLAGNVSEWCEDSWPGAPDEHVVRGSSWSTSSPAESLVSARQHAAASACRTDLGFRLVLTQQSP